MNRKAARRKRGSPKFVPQFGERTNAYGHCKAQLLAKIAAVGNTMKRTPSAKELQENGIPVASLRYRFGSLNEAIKQAGMLPNGNIASANYPKYSTTQLLRGLRLFKANFGHIAHHSDCGRGFLPASWSTYRRRFGTLAIANQQAEEALRLATEVKP